MCGLKEHAKRDRPKFSAPEMAQERDGPSKVLTFCEEKGGTHFAKNVKWPSKGSASKAKTTKKKASSGEKKGPF